MWTNASGDPVRRLDSSGTKPTSPSGTTAMPESEIPTALDVKAAIARADSGGATEVQQLDASSDLRSLVGSTKPYTDAELKALGTRLSNVDKQWLAFNVEPTDPLLAKLGVDDVRLAGGAIRVIAEGKARWGAVSFDRSSGQFVSGGRADEMQTNPQEASQGAVRTGDLHTNCYGFIEAAAIRSGLVSAGDLQAFLADAATKSDPIQTRVTGLQAAPTTHDTEAVGQILSIGAPNARDITGHYAVSLGTSNDGTPPVASLWEINTHDSGIFQLSAVLYDRTGIFGYTMTNPINWVTPAKPVRAFDASAAVRALGRRP